MIPRVAIHRFRRLQNTGDLIQDIVIPVRLKDLKNDFHFD